MNEQAGGGEGIAEPRTTYHHGDLRAALITATDELIAEGGIESFSLRAAAHRAGVSPGAPAHHFGGAKGLVTEVALLAFDRLDRALGQIEHSRDAATEVRTLSRAFIGFALEHPGHFRLMFRHELVDRTDPRWHDISGRPGMRLGRAIAAYHGNTAVDLERFEDAADMLTGLATLQGLAILVLEEKADHFFHNAGSDEFVEKDLPRVLERLYPALPAESGSDRDGPNGGSGSAGVPADRSSADTAAGAPSWVASR